ncbi:hypothetical protein SALBM135S_09070 [Streptomyces alboniger]
MASYCPHCGADGPDEARFCMKCGKERLPEPGAPDAPPAPGTPPAPEAPPAPAAPAAPPAPAFTPAPAVPGASAAPSPVGAFLGRTFRGDWAGSAQAALWPFALLLLSGIALAIPSYGQDDEGVVGFTARLRIGLALLLQSVGGGFELTGREERPGTEGTGGFGDSGGFGDTGGFGSGSDSASALEGAVSLHFVPLTVTVLWLVALFIGVRVLRGRLVARQYGQGGAPAGGTAGLEGAVRVTLLVAAGTLGLALFAQPEIEGIELSSSPALSALGALVLALVVACAVLRRDGVNWGAGTAPRPGAQALLRATGTAVRALAVVLALCSLVAFIGLAQIDDLDRATELDGDDDISPLLVALLILPNLAITALGIGWGAASEIAVRGSDSTFGDGSRSETFGLSELGDVTSDWAVVGALALGLVCALTIGVLAARRCVGRGEQLLAGGVFFGLVLLLAGVGGLRVEMSGAAADGTGVGSSGADGSVDLGLSVPEVLLFGLLWIFAAVLIAPYLLRMAGQSGGPAAPVYGPGTPPVPGTPASAPMGSVNHTPPAPAAPGTPPAGVPTPAHHQGALPSPYERTVSAYDPHAALLGQQAALLGQQAADAERRGRARVWVATLAGAFLIGGGATAGILIFQDGDDGKPAATADDGKSSATSSPQPSEEPSPLVSERPETETPEPSGSDEPGPADEGEVPAGSERVTDTEGFSFAVPEGWTRQAVNPERPGQITYAGPGREEFLVGVVRSADYTSYENFTNIEEHTKKAPGKSDYRRIRMEVNTYRGRDGALWEYTYTDRTGRTIHNLNQSYIAEDGTEYAIQLSWRESAWSTAQGATTHARALDTWRLTG